MFIFIYILVGLAVMWTLWRAWLPIGVAAPGRLLLEVPLGWRERWRWHRRNFYALTALLVLGALGGWLPFPLSAMIVICVPGIMFIPLRYRFTEEGVALNNVFFRRWEEFHQYRMEPWGIRLMGAGRMDSVCLYLPAGIRGHVRSVVDRRLRKSTRWPAKAQDPTQEVRR